MVIKKRGSLKEWKLIEHFAVIDVMDLVVMDRELRIVRRYIRTVLVVSVLLCFTVQPFGSSSRSVSDPSQYLGW